MVLTPNISSFADEGAGEGCIRLAENGGNGSLGFASYYNIGVETKSLIATSDLGFNTGDTIIVQLLAAVNQSTSLAQLVFEPGNEVSPLQKFPSTISYTFSQDSFVNVSVLAYLGDLTGYNHSPIFYYT